MNDDTYPEKRSSPRDRGIAPHVHDVQQVSEPDRSQVRDPPYRCGLDASWRARLAYGSEVREAKIRELQAAIKNGTYHVPAEQIADKMLRSTLRA